MHGMPRIGDRRDDAARPRHGRRRRRRVLRGDGAAPDRSRRHDRLRSVSLEVVCTDAVFHTGSDRLVVRVDDPMRVTVDPDRRRRRAGSAAPAEELPARALGTSPARAPRRRSARRRLARATAATEPAHHRPGHSLHDVDPQQFYFRQLLSGRDFAVGDPVATQMVNFVYAIGDRATGRVRARRPGLCGERSARRDRGRRHAVHRRAGHALPPRPRGRFDDGLHDRRCRRAAEPHRLPDPRAARTRPRG